MIASSVSKGDYKTAKKVTGLALKVRILSADLNLYTLFFFSTSISTMRELDVLFHKIDLEFYMNLSLSYR